MGTVSEDKCTSIFRGCDRRAPGSFQHFRNTRQRREMQPTDSIGIKSHKEATCQSGIFFVYLFKVLVDMIWDFVWRLCMAGLLGTVIGLDREYREKDAGFRTHFLVAMGSALMMIVSQWGFEEFLAVHDGLRLDPSRIAARW